MPIRFRCKNCDQLLGIARRKAGTSVRCPKCQTEVLVPQQDEEDSGPSPVPAPAPAPAPVHAPAPAQAPGLFDRDDFDALLRGTVSSSEGRSGRPATARTPPPTNRAPAPVPQGGVSMEGRQWPAAPANAGSVPMPPMQPGLVLSPARATVLTVLVILFLAISFALGLVVGRWLL